MVVGVARLIRGCSRRIRQRGRRAAWLFIASIGVSVLVAGPSALAQQLIHAQRADGADVPARIHRPAATSCAPLALLSPGAGGNENGLAYLAAGLRKDGWIAIVVGHRESGLAALAAMPGQTSRDRLRALATNDVAYRDRLADLSALVAWSRADAACAHPPFVALLGHSMGAATVMLEAGARNKVGAAGADRFDAYVALSPQGSGAIFPRDAWSAMDKPVLMLTGTRDTALDGPWTTRTTPWNDMPAGCKGLGIIDGATHADLGGNGIDAGMQAIALRTTLAFLDARRRGACAAPMQDSKISLRYK